MKKEIILSLAVFSIIILSGCKQITYVDKIAYTAEESYVVEEPYEITVPYIATEEKEVNESYKVPIKVDLSGNEIKPLEVKDHSTTLDGDTCVSESEIYNPNNAKILFNIDYIFDISISNSKSSKSNQEVDAFDTYTLTERGKKPYWLSDCGSVNIESEQITILDSPDIKNTFKTDWHVVTKQEEITKYKTEVRYREVVKTRPVTKYKDVLVTERVFAWQ